MAVVSALIVISSADHALVSRMSGAQKSTLEVGNSATVDLGMNIGVSVTSALAESVLACVLTAVTRLSCATNFEAYIARSSHNSSAWTGSMRIRALVLNIDDSTLQYEGCCYWTQKKYDRRDKGALDPQH